MTEIFILFLILFTTVSFFIYFNIKAKSLQIKFFNATELIKRIEKEKEEESKKFLSLARELEDQKASAIRLEKEKKEQLIDLDKIKQKYTMLEATFQASVKEAVQAARVDSVKRQRAILKGQATEHLAPYINSSFNPKDYKFLGDPIDYVIYEGLSEIKDKDDEILKIVFMDIKTGKSQLNKAQKAIKKCIEEGRVEFQIYRPEEDIETSD